jgi:hypothetical protein
MDIWRKYLKRDGSPYPGEVDNVSLLQNIYKLREKHGFPEYDDELNLKDKQDYFILST